MSDDCTDGPHKYERDFPSPSAPPDHVKDYNKVVTMLEFSMADSIMITMQEFQQYVLDEWSWKNEFAHTVSTYNNAPPRKVR